MYCWAITPPSNGPAFTKKGYTMTITKLRMMKTARTPDGDYVAIKSVQEAFGIFYVICELPNGLWHSFLFNELTEYCL